MQRRTLATLLSSLLFSISACSRDECPTGTSDCNGTCVALSSDVNNCGACGNSCGTDEVCAAGTCMDVGTTGCPSNLTDCSGTCVDTDADAANCGACGNACTGGLVCTAGACEVSCPASQTECSGACFDTQSAAQHCGDCGNACAAGQVCVSGDCEATCPAGQELCGTECATTDTDESNCGTCGNACDAGELCVGGNCELSCGGGSVACNGICTNTDTDLENCGGCGVQCDVDELCVAGSCALTCQGAQADCGGGTCTSTLTDELNCGGCGTVCGANELCNAGTCTLTCAGNTPDECAGVCTNTDTDAANCGGCGITCDAGEVCSAGSCASQCGAGLAQCGTTCTSTLTDPLNCGACGSACPVISGAASVCVSGSCAGVCNSGQADCDGDLTMSGGNGCETSLDDDATNCGSCGFACDFENAAATCAQASCEIGQCAAGFDNCDMNDANGCEAELATDPNNCNVCGNACPVGNICSSGTCINGAETGEDCTGPIVLLPGTNTYAWAAMNQDYLTAPPSCQTFSTVEGPDLVFRYTPAFNGFIDLQVDKPASQRFSMIISDAACGTTTELACASEFTATTFGFQVSVTANTDYFVYLIDTASGSGVLPNPVTVTVTETNCATQPPAQVVTLDPARSSTTSMIQQDLSVTFDQAINEDVGIVTITGNMGTNVSYDLSMAPAQVSFDAAGTTMTIDGIVYAPGETVTVSWTGLTDALCNATVPAPTPAWTFTAISPPCTPGTNGMVGTTQTRFATGLGSITEYYVVADDVANGWVYFGGTSDTYRMSKDGVTVQDIETLAGLTTSQQGYALHVDGNNIYTIESVTNGTTGHVFRISSNGGTTWFVEDAVTFPTAPADDFRSAASFGGLVYLVTHEGTSSVPTEVWAFDPSTVPATATLVASIAGGYTSCAGLHVDSTYFYMACGGGTEPILRVNRNTLVVDELTTAYDLSSTTNAVHGQDTNADGIVDFLYAQGWYEEAYFVCGIGGANFTDVHFQFNTGASSNYGMGFDPVANTLWMIDDGTRELIRIQ